MEKTSNKKKKRRKKRWEKNNKTFVVLFLLLVSLSLPLFFAHYDSILTNGHLCFNSNQQRTVEMLWSHETPSGWVQALSRALWWRREVSPQESPLPPPQPPTWGSELGGGPCPPFVQRKAKPGSPTLFLSYPFLLIIIVKTRETISLSRPAPISQYERLMFHDVWEKCGVSISGIYSVKIFSFFSSLIF